MPRCSGIGVFRHYLTLIRAQLGHVAHSARTARSLRHLRAVSEVDVDFAVSAPLYTALCDDEVEAMRRLGDREGEAITARSYGCGPIIRPRRGPFER